MLTCKFGGSSLSCCENFQKAAAILAADSHRRCVVVSAPGRRNPQDEKLTDLLYACQSAAAQGRGFSALFDRVAGRYLEIAQGWGCAISARCWTKRAPPCAMPRPPARPAWASACARS